MPIDLATIPMERLAMLDTEPLYHGSHVGTDDPDCKHCARELLHEVVTGRHADQTPPGCSRLIAVLPRFNDGPWRDDAHRTAVLRPYLRKLLALDPKSDRKRVYALVDHVYRSALPDVCDALKLDTHGSAMRDLAPISDRKGANLARDTWDAGGKEAVKNKAYDAGAYDAAGAYDVAAAAYAYAAYDAAAAAAAAAYAYAAYDAAAAAAAAYAAYDAYDAYAADMRRSKCYSEAWERSVKKVLDIICAIP